MSIVSSGNGVKGTRGPLPSQAEWAILGVLTGFVAAGVARRGADHPVLAALAGIEALAFGTLAIRGPRSGLLLTAALSSAGIVVLGNGTSSNVAWFALPLFAALCALAASLASTGMYWAGSMIVLVSELVFAKHDPGWAAWIGGTSFSTVACLFARRQSDLVDQLREAQAGMAQRAQAEERNRIARELHDVIAHTLTVSLLHVTSARLAVEDDPADAARSLAEAERLGRESLDEVRHAVGLLRIDGQADPTVPLPGSLAVPALLDSFRDAGADIQATVEGDLATLGVTVGLATYRILQEALTNAVKHAPGTAVTVRLTVEPEVVLLNVDSPGAPRQGNGLGLLGMRERAEALGGTCGAGPGGSGWLVRAKIPLAIPL